MKLTLICTLVFIVCIGLAVFVPAERQYATVLTTYKYVGFCQGREIVQAVLPVCEDDDGMATDGCIASIYGSDNMPCDYAICYSMDWTNVDHCHLFTWKWRCYNSSEGQRVKWPVNADDDSQ